MEPLSLSLLVSLTLSTSLVLESSGADISVEEVIALEECANHYASTDTERLALYHYWTSENPMIGFTDNPRCEEYEYWRWYRQYLATCSFHPNSTRHKCSDLERESALIRAELDLD